MSSRRRACRTMRRIGPRFGLRSGNGSTRSSLGKVKSGSLCTLLAGEALEPSSTSARELWWTKSRPTSTRARRTGGLDPRRRRARAKLTIFTPQVHSSRSSGISRRPYSLGRVLQQGQRGHHHHFRLECRALRGGRPQSRLATTARGMAVPSLLSAKGELFLVSTDVF